MVRLDECRRRPLRVALTVLGCKVNYAEMADLAGRLAANTRPVKNETIVFFNVNSSCWFKLGWFKLATANWAACRVLLRRLRENSRANRDLQRDTEGVEFRQGKNMGAPWGYFEDAHLRNGVSWLPVKTTKRGKSYAFPGKINPDL